MASKLQASWLQVTLAVATGGSFTGGGVACIGNRAREDQPVPAVEIVAAVPVTAVCPAWFQVAPHRAARGGVAK